MMGLKIAESFGRYLIITEEKRRSLFKTITINTPVIYIIASSLVLKRVESERINNKLVTLIKIAKLEMLFWLNF